MRQDDDSLGKLIIENVVDGILYGLHRVRKVGSRTRIRDTRNVGRSHGDNGQGVLRENSVRCEEFLEFCSVRVDVGTDHREVQRLDEVDQWVDAAVEFVISEGHGVKSNLVDSLGYHLRSEIGVEQSTLSGARLRVVPTRPAISTHLEFITSIEHQCILVLRL